MAAPRQKIRFPRTPEDFLATYLAPSRTARRTRPTVVVFDDPNELIDASINCLSASDPDRPRLDRELQALADGCPLPEFAPDFHPSVAFRLFGPRPEVSDVRVYAIGLLLTDGWRLHRCREETCRRWFLDRHKRTMRCSPDCQRMATVRRKRKSRRENANQTRQQRARTEAMQIERKFAADQQQQRIRRRLSR